MRDHETAMQVYVQLAAESHRKKQPLVRDRFLLLGGVEACRAGWLDVADLCREKIAASNPAHQVGHFPTMADALRDEDFQNVVAHWERWCPFEKAEAMLRKLKLPAKPANDQTVGEQMRSLLNE